jgi:Zn-dependent M28 family amino/carboxypeptidase
MKTSFNYTKLAMGMLVSMQLFSCGNNDNAPKKSSTQNTQAAYIQVSPEFNADSAYQFVQHQVGFGPRFTNSEGHTLCGNWLEKQFAMYADEVKVQKADVKNFDGKMLHIKNITASFNPEAKTRVLIAAHWDSRPYADQDQDENNKNEPILAADDAASGVAVLLEMARVMSQKKSEIGVDLICFDAEDLGKPQFEDSYCLGSQYWAKKAKESGYQAKYGVLLDMVGARNAKFVWEAFSVKYAESVVRKVWDQAVQLGYGNQFYYYRGGGITDDHFYVNTLANIPMIDIIHFSDETKTGFPSHWHTLSDNMAVIDRQTLKSVGQTLLETIYKEK